MTGSRQPEYGTCPACGAYRALRAGGTLRSHLRRTPQGYSAGRCAGTDQRPAKSTHDDRARCQVIDDVVCDLLLEDGVCVEHGRVVARG